jgi:hypothetical protein
MTGPDPYLVASRRPVGGGSRPGLTSRRQKRTFPTSQKGGEPTFAWRRLIGASWLISLVRNVRFLVPVAGPNSADLRGERHSVSNSAPSAPGP